MYSSIIKRIITLYGIKYELTATHLAHYRCTVHGSQYMRCGWYSSCRLVQVVHTIRYVCNPVPVVQASAGCADKYRYSRPPGAGQ
jgi:hypothetical protein